MFRRMFRAMYRLLVSLAAYFYDLQRFLKYSGWLGDINHKILNHRLSMVCHGLEKSLSAKNRNNSHGWENSKKLMALINSTHEKHKGTNYFYSLAVMKKFLEINTEYGLENHKSLYSDLSSLWEAKISFDDGVGYLELDKSDIEKGKLTSPENFFMSRYSMREFADENVDEELIDRSLRLALKTPSACNRKGWHVYRSADRDVITKALSLQNGNKSFGKDVPYILIVCGDRSAFFTGEERNQHLIDGGMFSMSLLYGLHSLGLAACALNWSVKPNVDRKLRKNLNISPHFDVLMMVAVGNQPKTFKVCRSYRGTLTDYVSKLRIMK